MQLPRKEMGAEVRCTGRARTDQVSALSDDIYPLVAVHIRFLAETGSKPYRFWQNTCRWRDLGDFG
jgi:hypothetical protein